MLIVLDRLDLVEQTLRQFKHRRSPAHARGDIKEELRRLLAEDQRGIIVTTIFRFEAPAC